MGKLALIPIASVPVFVVIAWRLDTTSLLLLASLVVVMLSLFGLGILAFGWKYPQQATLEGMEAVLMEQQTQFGTERKTISSDALDALEKVANPLNYSE